MEIRKQPVDELAMGYAMSHPDVMVREAVMSLAMENTTMRGGMREVEKSVLTPRGWIVVSRTVAACALTAAVAAATLSWKTVDERMAFHAGFLAGVQAGRGGVPVEEAVKREVRTPLDTGRAVLAKPTVKWTATQ